MTPSTLKMYIQPHDSAFQQDIMHEEYFSSHMLILEGHEAFKAREAWVHGI